MTTLTRAILRWGLILVLGTWGGLEGRVAHAGDGLVVMTSITLPTQRSVGPWAQGVSEADQVQAQVIYQEAETILWGPFRPFDALERYQRALTYWDHPMIRFRIACILVAIQRPQAAYSQLGAALRFGEAPLGAEAHQQALDLQKKLKQQLAWVTMNIDLPEVEVHLNDKVVDLSTGTKTFVLVPGTHRIVAHKPGYIRSLKTIRVEAGTHREIRIELIAMDRLLRPRWPQWQPWAVSGGGVVAASVGIGLLGLASNDLNTYERRIGQLRHVGDCGAVLNRDQCAVNVSNLPPDEQNLPNVARAKQAAGLTLIIAGTVAVLGGLIWASSNEMVVDGEQYLRLKCSNRPGGDPGCLP